MIKEKFLDVIRKYSDDEPYNSACWCEIENKYSSKSRYYHTLEHLENMLAELEQVTAYVQYIDTLLFAIYYHDIIYKPTQSNNEHQSALFFQKRIIKTSFPHFCEAMAQIEATKTHQLSTDPDTNIFLDIDLSILGKSPKEYKTYCENIRKEYRIYPDIVYRKGRKKVLENILAQNAIYKTVFFKQKFEAQAQENIRREVKQLT